MSNAASFPVKGRKGSAKKKNTLNEKAVFVWQALVGTKVVVVLSNGVEYQGIFHTWSGKKMSVCLKEVRRLNPPDQAQTRIVPQLIIDGDDVLYLNADDVDLEFNDIKSDVFKTDTAISGHSGEVKERELEKWQGEEAFSPNMTLGKQTHWDQFETNERLFGVDTDFNEEDYTTKLDRSDPSFKEKEAKAVKLAREIESATSTNIHIAEERGHAVFDKNFDEEARYSSVMVKGGGKNTLQVNRKSHEYKKAQKAGQQNASRNPPGIAPTWSQVAKKFNDGVSESVEVNPESPGENTENDFRGSKRVPSKSRVSASVKNADFPQSNTKVAMKGENKVITGGRVERQQFRDQITNATADRKISQRIIQKEAFKSFSEQINIKLPKVSSTSSASISNTTIEKLAASATIDSSKSHEKIKMPTNMAPSKAKTADETDKASETDSISTATTATRSKFKLNIDAAEFTPSGNFGPPVMDPNLHKRKSFPKRNPQTAKNASRLSYYDNASQGDDVPPPFIYVPGYPKPMPGSPFVPGMPNVSPDSAPSFAPMYGMPPPGGMFIPPSGGYPGMVPYQIGPMMVPGWMPYQVDENGNPIDHGYAEAYYGQTEEGYQDEENNTEEGAQMQEEGYQDE